MQAEFVLALIRHLLTFGGGYLASRGIADDAAVQQGIAAVMTLLSVVWSQFDAKQKATLAGK